MNNFNFFAQEGKLKAICLPSFCLVFLLFISSNFLLAQPDSFTISGCSVFSGAANGDYTRNATDVEGCPCYNNSNGGSLFKEPFTLTWIYNDTYTCTGLLSGFSYNVYAQGSDACDISTATTTQCDPSTTLSFPSPSSASIPTLSEWGLIILALLFMTAGTLYLVQPNFRKSFEQK
ncbi:MAG: IPTL-CTERM sorting domain-containing protein [Chitinophagales bacterium]